MSTTTLLNEREAAQYLNLSYRTLQRWRCTGEGPKFRKLNSAVRYHIDDLEAFAGGDVRTSTSDTGAKVA